MRRISLVTAFWAVAVLGGVTSLSNAQTTSQTAAQTTTATPRQLAEGMTCDEAKNAISDDSFGNLTSDQREEIYIAREHCLVAQNNSQHPDDPQVTIVAPNPSDADSNNKVFFKTIRTKDLTAVGSVCQFVGRQILTATEVMGGVNPVLGLGAVGLDVVTDGGKVTCDGYIKAAQNNNILVVLAPSIITGTVITVHVLNMIGLGKQAREVQSASDDVRKAAGNLVAKSVDDIKRNSLILIAGPIAAPIVVTAAVLHRSIPQIHPHSCRLQFRCSGHGRHIHCSNMCG